MTGNVRGVLLGGIVAGLVASAKADKAIY